MFEGSYTGKYVAYDVAAWSDLWFYSNPIFIEVKGSFAVAGRQVSALASPRAPCGNARRPFRFFLPASVRPASPHDHDVHAPPPRPPARKPPPPEASVPRRAWSPWLREPLLHFVLLGALLFGIDHAVVTSQRRPAQHRRRPQRDRRGAHAVQDVARGANRMPTNCAR